MARPRKKIDVQQLEKLASIGLSTGEMAAVLKCSPDTLQRRFANAMETGRQHRNASLKRKQFEVAMKGNPTMLIWLGKQFLDQRDKHEQKIVRSLSDLSDEELAAISISIGKDDERGDS